MPRPILATISSRHMAHNLARVKSLTQKEQDFSSGPAYYAVVKANAYGHGLQAAVHGFAAADGLALIETEQLAHARQLGWTKDLFLLEGIFEPADTEALQVYQAGTAIHCLDQLVWLQQLSPNAQIPVMLKINTGMNRLGMPIEHLPAAFAQIQQLQAEGKIGAIGLMSHFANADAAGDALEGRQIAQAWQQMQMACHVAKQQLVASAHALSQPSLRLSVCNSAASLRFAKRLLPMGFEHILRPGICLYGSSPMGMANSETAADFDLRPAMSLKAQIIAVQTLQKGDSVGYGSLFTADKPTRVGIVACGYADGYPRSATAQTPVKVAGRTSYLLGRVSMDMLCIDLTDIPESQAGVGSWVYLWGEQGPSIDEVAASAGRISYEILCSLANRVPKQLQLSDDVLSSVSHRLPVC